jgi:hypothetical protein
MSIKFIDSSDVHFTAGEASEVDSLDLGAMLVSDTKFSSFRIGNTGSGETDLQITVSGDNTSINDDVDFSLDGITYSATVVVSGVQPNEVTDLIRVRYESQEGDVIGIGSFLIKVDEI